MYSLLQSCIKKKNLVAARQMQCLIIDDGLDVITFWSDHLIRLFAICSSLYEANRSFCKVVKPTTFTWNAIISAHEKLGEPKMALELYSRMQADGILPDMVTYLCILKACGGLGVMDQGRLIHEEIVWRGLEEDVNVGSTLVDMYAKCRGLEDARQLFDRLSSRNVVTWGAMIAGYAQNWEGLSALKLFENMQEEGIMPSNFTFSCALKACGSVGAIHEGRLLHHEVLRNRYETDVVIGSTLTGMYSDCGLLEEACRVFDELPNRDMVSWGIMISAFVAHGHGLSALDLFERLQGSSLKPNIVIFLCILQACGTIRVIRKGRLIHHEIIERGLESRLLVRNTLIDMYAKCGCLEEAHQMFEYLPEQDLVSWGALIAGFVEYGRASSALELFYKMLEENIKPNRVIFLCSLKACGISASFWQGRLIHDLIVSNGLESEGVLGNALVGMYVQFGDLEDARCVFDDMSEQGELSWGVMLAGYASNGHGFQALEFFEKMQAQGLKPNKIILLLILKACSSVGAIREGRQIHMEIIRIGLQTDVVIGSAVVDMYLKCANLEEACKVFEGLPSEDVVSFGAMIEGYVQQGHGLLALELFAEMQGKGIEPSKAIVFSILKAGSSMGAIGWGFLIHHQVFECGFESDVEVGSTLVDTYAKCGYLEEAHKVFDDLQDSDLLSWSALIAGCVQEGQDFVAIELYEKMREKGIQPDNVLFLLTLKACMHVGAIKHGRMVHDELVRIGLDSDTIVRNRLADTYAGCGRVDEAYKLFDGLTNPRVISYGAISTGLVPLDKGQFARANLQEIARQGLKPADPTFSGILAACSHAGLLREGCCYLSSMTEDYGVTPNIQHYSCMVDLLGRVGHLDEAESLIKTMPISPDTVTWISLLTNCKTHGALELGKQCFQHVVELNPSDSSGNVLTSNIYASAQILEGADLDELRKHSVGQKKPGRAVLELKHKVHAFFVGGTSHPQSEGINAQLSREINEIKKKSYVLKLDFVSQPMWADNMENAVCTNNLGHGGAVENMESAMCTSNSGCGRAVSSIKLGSSPYHISRDSWLYVECLNACGFISRNENLQNWSLRDIGHIKDMVCAAC